MANASLLYIGIKGTVLALDRATGQQVWSTPLKGSDFVNVAVTDGELYATARGELYRLDPVTGEVLWKNALTGFGWGLVSMATAGGGQTVVMQEKKRRDAAATAAGTSAAT